MNHLVEKFRTLEKTSVLLEEHVNVLQQGVVAVCMKFERMFAIEFDEASQVEGHKEPAAMFEFRIQSCDDFSDDSLTDCSAFGSVNSSTEFQPEHLQPDSVETSPPAESVIKSSVESCFDSFIRLPVLDSESPPVHDEAPSFTLAMPASSIPMSFCQPDRLRHELVLFTLKLTPELSLCHHLVQIAVSRRH